MCHDHRSCAGSAYVGPVANALGGADIAWIVGFVFAAVAYYAGARYRMSASAPAGGLRSSSPVRREEHRARSARGRGRTGRAFAALPVRHGTVQWVPYWIHG